MCVMYCLFFVLGSTCEAHTPYAVKGLACDAKCKCWHLTHPSPPKEPVTRLEPAMEKSRPRPVTKYSTPPSSWLATQPLMEAVSVSLNLKQVCVTRGIVVPPTTTVQLSQPTGRSVSHQLVCVPFLPQPHGGGVCLESKSVCLPGRGVLHIEGASLACHRVAVVHAGVPSQVHDQAVGLCLVQGDGIDVVEAAPR